MKLRYIFAALSIISVLYTSTSCRKTNSITTVHDSTTVIVRDTVLKRDTTIKIDTLVLTNPKNPVTGLWVGTYTIDGNVAYGTFYYSWAVFPDHTIITRGGAQNGITWTGAGTWSLSADSTFTADTNGTDPSEGNVPQHITAKYSSVNGTMTNGKVAYTNGNSQTQSFTLERAGNQ
jgi:autotransporter-associated beta strand protein